MLIDFNYSLILLTFVIWLGLSIFLKKRKNKSNTYILFFTIFYIYLMYVVKYTQFPIILHNNQLFSFNEVLKANIIIIPENFSIDYLTSSSVLLNILLSIPFGFGIPYLVNASWKKILFFAISFGIIIESLQLTTLLIARFSLRIVDINDVLFNFIGVIVGYILFLLFSSVYKKLVETFNIELNSLTRFIYEVSSGTIKN